MKQLCGAKYYGCLLATMMLLFGVEYAFLRMVIPNHFTPYIIVIPMFFILVGFISIRFVYIKPDVSITLLLGLKTVKILISLTIVLVYILIVREHSVSFLFSFLYYALAYIIFETIVVYTVNKKKKQNESSKK